MSSLLSARRVALAKPRLRLVSPWPQTKPGKPLSLSTLIRKRTLRTGRTAVGPITRQWCPPHRAASDRRSERTANYAADFVVINTPGKSDSAAIEAARVADLVLVPLGPLAYHLETLPGLRDLLRVAGDKPALVVLNAIHPQATKQAEEAKRMIADLFGFSVCPTHFEPPRYLRGHADHRQHTA